MNEIVLFPKISIMGMDCIGKAIGLSVKRLGIADHVTGIDEKRKDLVQKAKESGAVDECTDQIIEGVQDCDLLILDLPYRQILDIMPNLASAIKPGCIVTDTAGLKKNLMEKASILFGKDRYFIGSHPMVTITKSDRDKSWDVNLQNKTAFVTFLPQTDKKILARVSLFWKTLGMVPFLIDPLRHDQYMTLSIHLPYAVACVLSRLASDIPEDVNFIRQITGKEFRDATQIAAGDVSLWTELLKQNSEHILPTIDRMISELQTLRNRIESSEADELKDILTDISEFRNKL